MSDCTLIIYISMKLHDHVSRLAKLWESKLTGVQWDKKNAFYLKTVVTKTLPFRNNQWPCIIYTSSAWYWLGESHASSWFCRPQLQTSGRDLNEWMVTTYHHHTRAFPCKTNNNGNFCSKSLISFHHPDKLNFHKGYITFVQIYNTQFKL